MTTQVDDERGADSRSAPMRCSAAGDGETRSAQPTQEEADELLMDVWHSQSHPTQAGGRWAGGLSTLEAIQVYLDKRGRLYSNGNVIW